MEPQPHPVALAIGLDLVTRYRLRLTDRRDGRLGPLGDQYELGAAAWTGRRAAFVGFYRPTPDPEAAARDLEERCRAAAAWGEERLRVQGAERCDILLLALGPVARPAPVASAPGVTVGAASVDPPAGTATALLPLPRGLPGLAELRAHARAVRDGRPVPTLAAVDLAERQTVAGGHVRPTRRALASTTPATFTLIGAFAMLWLAETAAVNHLRTIDAGDPQGVFDAKALLALGGLPNSGTYAHDWWRYIGSAFLHDTRIYHVLSNCFAMFFIGRIVEQLYGRLVLVGTFLFTAGTAGAFWVAFTALGISSANPVAPGIGASGGVAGLAGLLVMLGRVQGREVPVGLSASIRQYVILIAVLNLVIGLSLPGVNNWVHLGGFASGALLGMLLPPVAGIGGRDLRPAERIALVAVIVASVVAHAIDVVNQGQIQPDPSLLS